MSKYYEYVFLLNGKEIWRTGTRDKHAKEDFEVKIEEKELSFELD